MILKKIERIQKNLLIKPIKEEDEYKSDSGLFPSSPFEKTNASTENELKEPIPNNVHFYQKVFHLEKDKLHLKNNEKLFLAAINGDFEALDSILKQVNVSVNVKNIDGTTPLHWASANGHFKCVESFIGCDEIRLDIKDIHGYTALHWAAMNGHSQCVSCFLEIDDFEVFQGRFRLNAKDYRGQTALHLASKSGHFEVVKLLLNSKIIALHLKDLNDETALDLAKKNKHYKVIELIQNSTEINKYSV